MLCRFTEKSNASSSCFGGNPSLQALGSSFAYPICMPLGSAQASIGRFAANSERLLPLDKTEQVVPRALNEEIGICIK